MARNKMTDMNDHLFESLEWLGDRSLTGDDLKEEIARAQAKCNVAVQIIANRRLALDAIRLIADFPDIKNLPPLLE
jgi:hypothetical protein